MKSILFIEDDPEISGKLLKEFQDNNIKVIHCPDRKSAEEAIQIDVTFDAVILDWFFQSTEDSVLSKLILKKLKGVHFRPVFIYTNNKSDFDKTPKGDIEFPENLITCYSKEISLPELKNKISELLSQNISLQIANAYRLSLRATFESIMFELNELPDIDLAKIFHKMYGTGENVDWSNDIILNLIHSAFVSDEDFISKLISLLKKIKSEEKALSSAEGAKIVNKILYYKSKSDYIRNGDLVSIQKSDKSILAYGIVITPDCDLEQKKTRHFEIVELIPINDAKLGLTQDQIIGIKNSKNDSFYYFPALAIGGELTDFVAILKSKLVLIETLDINQPKYPHASKRLLYSLNFICNGENVKLNLACSKTNPYKSDFLQKLHANNSRVGIPDIKDLFG